MPPIRSETYPAFRTPLLYPYPYSVKKADETNLGYQVLNWDQTAHTIFNKSTEITACAVFDTYLSANDELLLKVPTETTEMHQKQSDDWVHMSIYDPNQNIEEKTYTALKVNRIFRSRLSGNDVAA